MLLTAAEVESKYWEGPGPVSGDNYVVTLPRHCIPPAVEAFEDLGRRLQALLPAGEMEGILDPLPPRDKD
jgi:hypothetical protein